MGHGVSGCSQDSPCQRTSCKRQEQKVRRDAVHSLQLLSIVLTVALKETHMDGLNILVRNSGQLSRHVASIFRRNTHIATFLLASP